MKGNNGLLQKVWHYLRENPSEIIFGTYLFLIMLISIYVAIYCEGRAYELFIVILLLFMFLLVPKLHRWIGKFSFTPAQDISRRKKMQVFGFAGGISFTVLLFCFIGFYPGAYWGDMICQYEQVIKGSYDDWHPVWHTLLIFFLPLKLTGGWSSSVVLFQMIYFSLLMGYMTVLIYIYSGRVYACISAAFILLNPFTLQIVMSPTKDVAFAIASALCMLYAMNIYFTKGKWCDRRYRIVLFAFMLACATLFRHNGILFSFFLLFALFFNMPRKSWRMLNETTCIIFVCIKLLYWFLNAGVPNGRIMETTGLPLSIIVNVAKECPERLDERTSDFVSDLMVKQPNWKVRHNISGINTVKMDDKFKELAINESAIENAGVCCILQMMCHCFRVAPKQSFEAFVGLTIPVYGLEITGGVGVGVDENDIGLAYNGVEDIVSWVEGYCRSVYGTPLRFIFTIGFTILIMLAFILFKSNFRSFEDWKRILLCFPIFTYNFGTMLLLSGHDVRFFYISFLVCPLVVLIMAGKRV